MDRTRQDPVRADPLTRVVAERVKVLRNAQRLSGAALSRRVRDLGAGSWVDSTVSKLETLRRETISITELLALAVALDVPPTWLLIDPKSDAAVPIAEGVERDPWTTALWLSGRQPLTSQPGSEWQNASDTLVEVLRLVTLIERFEQFRAAEAEFDADDAIDLGDSVHRDNTDMRLLGQMVSPMQKLLDAGYRIPTLPDDLLKRARELGVELPVNDTRSGS